MRKIVLFSAMSLDGYIADRRGGIGWLNGQGCDNENIGVYSEFVKEIDTILMGWNTYHQVTTHGRGLCRSMMVHIHCRYR